MIYRQRQQVLTSLLGVVLLLGLIAILLIGEENQVGVKHVLILPFWFILFSELLSGVQGG